jgi:hypothetical protein
MSDDYRVYSVSHTNEKNEDGGRAYTLQASYDSAELAVAAAVRLAKAKDAWLRVKHNVEVIWDNGEELDDEPVPVRIRSLTKHMMAEGLPGSALSDARETLRRDQDRRRLQ